MAIEIQGFRFGHRSAGADLSSSQYFCVKHDSSADIVLAGNGEPISGILQNKPANGEIADVQVDAISKCVFGATLAAGALASSDAAGKVVAPATGERIIGIIDEGGDADEVGSILLKDLGRLA